MSDIDDFRKAAVKVFENIGSYPYMFHNHHGKTIEQGIYAEFRTAANQLKNLWGLNEECKHEPAGPGWTSERPYQHYICKNCGVELLATWADKAEK